MYKILISLVGFLLATALSNTALANEDTIRLKSYEMLDFDRLLKDTLLKMPNSFEDEIKIEKNLLYNKYTIGDVYPYRDTVREVQWYKIRKRLQLVESLINDTNSTWGVLQNYKNANGKAPLVRKYKRDKFNKIYDSLGTGQNQSVPLYKYSDSISAEIYGRDGTLVRILSQGKNSKFSKISTTLYSGEWLVPNKYVRGFNVPIHFGKVIFIDVNNQNIVTLEKSADKWIVRSMSPATTGENKPPHKQATPVGMFLVQEKKPKMFYQKDGGTEIEGYAPYASRFTNGGHIHGVPVNLPRTDIIEFSATLGTTPRSHMCVRSASSHAEFIFNWANLFSTIVFVID